MKIGLVLDDTLDTPDGVQQYVLMIGGWLTEQGHDVHYLVGATVRTDLHNLHSLSRNIQVSFNGNSMSIPLPTAKRRLRTFLQGEQFDILHVQVPYSPFLAGRLILSAPKTTAIVGTFHILPLSRIVAFANRGLAVLNWRSGKRFDTMLAVSEPAKLFARKTYGYAPIVLPNPIRLTSFTGATSASKELNIVFLGRLVERKGAAQLLQSIVIMRKQKLFKDHFRVHIGGKGPLLPALQQYVHSHGLQDIVSFDGFIAEADKATFLAQADIAVYPSLGGESFGIVLLEAMASARGVVLAGNNPGYASVMAPFPEQLFEPSNTTQLAEKLAAYAHNAAKRSAAVVAQKEYVQRFDIALVGEQLTAVYKKALQSRRKT